MTLTITPALLILQWKLNGERGNIVDEMKRGLYIVHVPLEANRFQLFPDDGISYHRMTSSSRFAWPGWYPAYLSTIPNILLTYINISTADCILIMMMIVEIPLRET